MIRPKSARALVEAVRIAKQNPNARFDVPHDFPLDSADVLRLWDRGLMNRCNRGLPELTAEQEREYRDMQLDADRVNEYIGQRIRHTGCRNLLRTAAMKARYPHIDNQPSDY